jgi:hypothetical protein
LMEAILRSDLWFSMPYWFGKVDAECLEYLFSNLANLLLTEALKKCNKSVKKKLESMLIKTYILWAKYLVKVAKYLDALFKAQCAFDVHSSPDPPAVHFLAIRLSDQACKSYSSNIEFSKKLASDCVGKLHMLWKRYEEEEQKSEDDSNFSKLRQYAHMALWDTWNKYWIEKNDLLPIFEKAFPKNAYGFIYNPEKPDVIVEFQRHIPVHVSSSSQGTFSAAFMNEEMFK